MKNLKWKTPINNIENKISKSLGMLYKAKFMLNQNCLKSIYFSFIHCHLSYANIVWASTNPRKLKKLSNQQKHAARIICNEDRLSHAKPLMEKPNILNIYQSNIIQTTTFMLKIKLNLTPDVFLNKFQQIKHKYPTAYASNNFVMPQKQLKISKYSITIRGPKLWNNLLHKKIKTINCATKFKTTVKQKLHNFTNIISLFQ